MSMLNFFAAASSQCPATASKLPLLPTWYKYLECTKDPITNAPSPVIDISNLSSIWAIGFGVIDILLMLAGIIAIGYVIFGGFQYITSTANPDAISKAKDTILNALIGLVIVIIASAVVSFIGNAVV